MFQCDCPPDDCAARVRRFLAGDRGAGDELARKFTPLVQAVVQRILRSERRGDWDDACQDIFLRMFARLDRWEARCPFCKWLAVVAARRAIDQVRDPHPTRGLPPGEIVDPRPPPLSSETISRLERALGDLPPAWRRAYDRAVEGATREEIARAEGKSVRTIHYWLAVVRDRLLACLPG
jgi:RNA polymerase sigma-70 factor (ECF subfamily)